MSKNKLRGIYFYGQQGLVLRIIPSSSPGSHKKSVATAWLCLGRAELTPLGPASISPSGHQSPDAKGQALCSRMLTSLSPSCLGGKSCFEARWEAQAGGWLTAVLFWECSGTNSWYSRPCWVRTPEWCLCTLQSQKFSFGKQSLRSLTVLSQILGFCLPHLLISYGHELEWACLYIL